MATADQITSFLNNEMSPEQERGFLLTVASSDSLRLELKSHVMLDRIFVAQTERAEVPEAVRGLIFAQAGVSIDGSRADDAPRSNGAVEAGRRFSRAFMSRFVRGGMVLLVASSGFAAGYFSRSSDAPAVTSRSNSSTATESAAIEPSTVKMNTTEMNTTTVNETGSTNVARPDADRPVDGAPAAMQSGTAGRTVAARPVPRSTSTVDRTAKPSGEKTLPTTDAPSSVSTPVTEPAVTLRPPAASVEATVRNSKGEKVTNQEEQRMP